MIGSESPDAASGPPLRARAADAAESARLLGAAPIAAYRCVRGDDGRATFVSQEGALADELGLSTVRVAGQAVEDVLPREAARELLRELDRAFAGQETDAVHVHDGRAFRHELKPAFSADGSVESVLGAMVDITDAERANEDVRIFAAAISHDLRAPLTIARNYNAILRRRHAERMDPDGRKYLGKIDDALARMSDLMEDLLRLTEASRVELDLREVWIGEIASQTAAILREREPDLDVSLHVDAMAVGWGDERLVRILVENILESAWKGARAAPGCTIEFAMHPADGETVFSLSVTADGVGKADAARLFRGEDALTDPSGMGAAGIALAIIETIVRRHGGRMWTSGGDGRAAFCFTLAPEWCPAR